jgi:DNA-binding transcriptional LysR family regulator
LRALDALLTLRSVSGAARRLGLSDSAMSRTLSRLRKAMQDPILVSAGRGMVATPHAEAIAAQVRQLYDGVEAVLRPPAPLSIAKLRRDFTVRANEAFALGHAARLSALVVAAAPGVRLRFAPKPDKDTQALRDGRVDLDIGVLSGRYSDELRAQLLFRDRFVGVARCGHPLLERLITPETYVAYGHVIASKRGRADGPVDAALAELGLERRISVIAPSFPAVVAVAAASDLLGLTPATFFQNGPKLDAVMFDLPVATREIEVSQIWHPRLDADPGHIWLRGLIFEAFRPWRQAGAQA